MSAPVLPTSAWASETALDRHSPAYAAGIEVGMLFQRLATEPLPLRAMVHEYNAEVVQTLAEAFGAEARTDEVGPDHLAVTFT